MPSCQLFNPEFWAPSDSPRWLRRSGQGQGQTTSPHPCAKCAWCFKWPECLLFSMQAPHGFVASFERDRPPDIGRQSYRGWTRPPPHLCLIPGRREGRPKRPVRRSLGGAERYECQKRCLACRLSRALSFRCRQGTAVNAGRTLHRRRHCGAQLASVRCPGLWLLEPGRAAPWRRHREGVGGSARFPLAIWSRAGQMSGQSALSPSQLGVHAEIPMVWSLVEKCHGMQSFSRQQHKRAIPTIQGHIKMIVSFHASNTTQHPLSVPLLSKLPVPENQMYPSRPCRHSPFSKTPFSPPNNRESKPKLADKTPTETKICTPLYDTSQLPSTAKAFFFPCLAKKSGFSSPAPTTPVSRQAGMQERN
jgi:hypothetical protein